MQYDKDLFDNYLRNYFSMKERLEHVANVINKLLEDEHLQKTIKFYNSLTDRQKHEFIDINLDNKFTRYIFNQKIADMYDRDLKRLLEKFFDSKAFPFSSNKDVFIRNNGVIISANKEEKSTDFNLTSEENTFLYEAIDFNVYYDIDNSLSIDDIPFIKVASFLSNKTKPNDIVSKLLTAKSCDEDNITYKPNDMSRVDHLKWELNTYEELIRNSDSKFKDLLLFDCLSVSYELEILSGRSANSIYNDLLEELKNKTIAKDLFEFNLDALCKAYYNMIDKNFRKASGYFSIWDIGLELDFFTANEKINKRILEMKKR